MFDTFFDFDDAKVSMSIGLSKPLSVFFYIVAFGFDNSRCRVLPIFQMPNFRLSRRSGAKIAYLPKISKYLIVLICNELLGISDGCMPILVSPAMGFVVELSQICILRLRK